MHISRYVFSLVLAVCGFLLVMMGTSCSHTVGTTTVHIVDSVRHYYPVTMGQELTIRIEIQNTGKESLVIDDIQPSWGCFDIEEESATDQGDGGDFGIIPVGKKQVFFIKYDTDLNTGKVNQCVRIYGNLAPNGVAYLKFDVNIVPPTDASLDYEENYYEKVKHQEEVKGLIDGNMSERSYYTDYYDYY